MNLFSPKGSRVVRALLTTIVLALALLAGTAGPTSAHAGCVGRCNKIENVTNIGIGIYDYSRNSYWSWILGRGRTDVSYPYQQEVEGFYIGNGFCFQMWQSNDNYNFGYWGQARGPFKMTTTYWEYNRVNVFGC